jgi:ubiquinol-cytochrome c reductase cytochrome c subunit
MKTSAIILAFAAAVSFAGVANAADAARGKQVFDRVGCWQCHGYEGQGANTGPKLAPEPMDVEALRSFLRNSASTTMPPYSAKILSDEEVADIQAYLASVKKPPAAKDIPLLRSP